MHAPVRVIRADRYELVYVAGASHASEHAHDFDVVARHAENVAIEEDDVDVGSARHL